MTSLSPSWAVDFCSHVNFKGSDLVSCSKRTTASIASRRFFKMHATRIDFEENEIGRIVLIALAAVRKSKPKTLTCVISIWMSFN
jgi:hypothetical protein